jgi:hypothetical protein
MSTAHVNAYRLAMHRIDAALRVRTSDDVVVFVWSDNTIDVLARNSGISPAAEGRVPVIVYVDGIPCRTAEHPLPERRAATPLRRAV